MPLLRPDGVRLYEGGGLTVGLTGSSYVGAVTDGSDSTWAQMRQSGGFSALAFAKWTLPALACPTATSTVAVVSRMRWDTSTLNGLPASRPEGDYFLTWESDGQRVVGVDYDTAGLVADTIVDVNSTIDTTSTASKRTNYANWLDQLAAGTAEIWTTLDFQSGVSNRLDVIELAVRIDCGGPKVRQRQRDDFRQRQRESRQLAPRGRSYI